MNKKALFFNCVRDSEPAKRDPLGRRLAGGFVLMFSGVRLRSRRQVEVRSATNCP